jgi:two-component system sensor histidine kinase KdpD
VGKTCRLLQEGHERLGDGTDVVIGLLETHGRRESARRTRTPPPVRSGG